MYILYFVYNINISFIFLIIGSIIGAGFSSGKEIFVFFSRAGIISYLIILVITILLFFVILSFIKLSKTTKVDNIFSLNKILFKINYNIFNIFILVGLFIFLTAMVAGLNSVGEVIFKNINFPILSIISLLFCLFISSIGYSAIKKVNNILMPIVIILIIFVSVHNLIFKNNNTVFYNFSALNFIKFLCLGVFYIGYNIVFSSGLIVSNSKNFTTKQAKINSFLISLILGGLILLINLTMLNSGSLITSSDMPLLFLAFNINGVVGYIFAFVLWFSILTSLISSLYLFVNNFKNKFLISCIVLTLSFILSFFGFSSIINYVYPIQGIISIIFIVKVFIYNLKIKNFNKFICNNNVRNKI